MPTIEFVLWYSSIFKGDDKWHDGKMSRCLVIYIMLKILLWINIEKLLIIS